MLNHLIHFTAVPGEQPRWGGGCQGENRGPLRFALLPPGRKQNFVLRSDYYQEEVHGDFRRELLNDGQ